MCVCVGGGLRKILGGVCRWNFEYTPYSCNFQTDKTYLFIKFAGVVGWCEGAVYLTSLGRPTDIGLQLGKACYYCSG